MLTKVINILKIVYSIIKKDIWPYRYYILLILWFITTFTMEMITYTRIIRFLVILIMIIIYKYISIYIHNYTSKNLNIKLLIILMYYNIIINPILFFIWNLNKYVYKIIILLNKKIKNKKIYKLLKWMIISLIIPIIYIHMRYYKMLENFQIYNFYEILFIRVYGLIISILIFSDIINYLLNVSGGLIYLTIYIYLIIYIINIIYVCYILWIEPLNLKYLKNCLDLKIIKYIKKMYIYIWFSNYIKGLILVNNQFRRLSISTVYMYRINYTLTGSLIKKILTSNIEDLKKQSFFKLYIDKIPSMWRYCIYLLPLNNLKLLFGNSYIEHQTTRWNCYNIDDPRIYQDIFLEISEIFKLLESVLYFKYFNVNNAVIKTSEYEYAYKLYYLILKNILHFMWSFEYHLDKNKLTKLYVDKHIGEYGYSIYFNEECIDNLPAPFRYQNFSDFLNNENYKSIYESIYLLINLSEKDWMYVGYKENDGLKNLNNVHLKYQKLFDNSGYVDVMTVYEKEKEQSYLLELNNLIKEIKKDWECLDPLDIFNKRTVFLELINHLKKNGA